MTTTSADLAETTTIGREHLLPTNGRARKP